MSASAVENSQERPAGSASAPGTGPARKRSRLVRGLKVMGLAIVAYIAIGNLLHRVVFPMDAPDPSTYPRAGDRFGCEAEGFEHEVISVEDGWVRSELVVHPGAEGPPLHYHKGFDEAFTIKEGTLHLQVGDEILQLRAGESYRVPAGKPHKPFNPGSERVVIGGGDLSVPQSFAACLVQLYAFIDERGRLDPGLDMLLQMSVIDPICDTHLARPPSAVIAVTDVLVAPIARLAGYRNYDPARSLHPPAEPRSR